MKRNVLIFLLITVLLVSACESKKSLQETNGENVVNTKNNSVKGIKDNDTTSMEDYTALSNEIEHKSEVIEDNPTMIVGGKSGNMINYGLADTDEDNIIYVWNNEITIVDKNGDNKKGNK